MEQNIAPPGISLILHSPFRINEARYTVILIFRDDEMINVLSNWEV